MELQISLSATPVTISVEYSQAMFSKAEVAEEVKGHKGVTAVKVKEMKGGQPSWNATITFETKAKAIAFLKEYDSSLTAAEREEYFA